jgi:hypothetical protein
LTKSTALQQGAVDLIDQLPHDQTPILDHAPGIVLRRISPIDSYGIIRPNQLYPPFDSAKARQALALSVDQREYASAAFGDQKWCRECWSFFVCGSANGTEVGSEGYRRQDLMQAKQLFAESGYEGEKIVLISTGEIPGIAALGDVTADNLRKIGVDVEVAVSDWGTMPARRAKKDPPAQGGVEPLSYHSGRHQHVVALDEFLRSTPAVAAIIGSAGLRRTNRGVANRLHPRFRRSAKPHSPRSPSPSSLGDASRYPSRPVHPALCLALQCHWSAASAPDGVLEYRQGVSRHFPVRKFKGRSVKTEVNPREARRFTRYREYGPLDDVEQIQ